MAWTWTCLELVVRRSTEAEHTTYTFTPLQRTLAPWLDRDQLQVEHERLVHHARLGGEDEIERALAGEGGGERPDCLEAVGWVSQILGDDDSPDTTSRHPTHSLVHAGDDG